MIAKFRIAVLAIAVLAVAGCADNTRSATVAMPSPSAGDTMGQIMSVTGTGFTICGVIRSADGTVNAGEKVVPGTYDVTVCGSVREARIALDARFPGKCALSAYRPDDGGPHTARALVMQWWILRLKGLGFQVTETEILSDGTIDVGIAGSLQAARTALNREFPGWTKVHVQSPSVDLVGKT